MCCAASKPPSMEPYAEGQALPSAAVAMTTFFVFAIWSAANLKRTKCKLYEVLLVSAIGKPTTSPSSTACLQRRSKDPQAWRDQKAVGVGATTALYECALVVLCGR